MSKEEINNEKPDDILGMIHRILDFNKKIQKQQGSGLKLKMETIFMNIENSKTSEPHRFELDLTDKLNLKNPNKNMALANLSIYYTWKNIKSEYNNNNFLHQLGMILLVYLMVLILLLIFKIILNLSSKNMKL